MQTTVDRNKARAAARAYESALPTAQRKALGQFFTGVPLGKLLAHIALDPGTATVLDPMAGHGDLLDATWEAANDRGIAIERLDGIETRRTHCLCMPGPAFEDCWNSQQFLAAHLHRQRIRSRGSGPTESCEGYDLVITNPPYVRYQARKGSGDWVTIQSAVD